MATTVDSILRIHYGWPLHVGHAFPVGPGTALIALRALARVGTVAEADNVSAVANELVRQAEEYEEEGNLVDTA